MINNNCCGSENARRIGGVKKVAKKIGEGLLLVASRASLREDEESGFCD
jgi:hypothetical protein